MKNTTKARWITLPLGIILTFLVFGAVNGHCQTVSSKSESTLPPFLTEAVGATCEFPTIYKQGTVPYISITLIIKYKDEKHPDHPIDLGKIYISEPSQIEKREHEALSRCQEVRKRIREEIVRELKRKAPAS